MNRPTFPLGQLVTWRVAACRAPTSGITLTRLKLSQAATFDRRGTSTAPVL